MLVSLRATAKLYTTVKRVNKLGFKAAYVSNIYDSLIDYVIYYKLYTLYAINMHPVLGGATQRPTTANYGLKLSSVKEFVVACIRWMGQPQRSL